jgi:hypothetical protein
LEPIKSLEWSVEMMADRGGSRKTKKGRLNFFQLFSAYFGKTLERQRRLAIIVAAAAAAATVR